MPTAAAKKKAELAKKAAAKNRWRKQLAEQALPKKLY